MSELDHVHHEALSTEVNDLGNSLKSALSKIAGFDESEHIKMIDKIVKEAREHIIGIRQNEITGGGGSTSGEGS